METYSNYSPTAFDDKGIVLDDRQNWLVLPCGQNRDSEALDLSNFENALEILGGESETVEVHRFGHWACGWIEIIIVQPDTEEHSKALEIESALENYPVLNDEDFSAREYEESLEYIRNAVSDFSDRAEEIFSNMSSAGMETGPQSLDEKSILQSLDENDIARACDCCEDLTDCRALGSNGNCIDCIDADTETSENALLIALADIGISEDTRYVINAALGRGASPYSIPNLLPNCA